jgi:outer membrane protein OmpA-like peptidoglycan-associated protein
MSLSQNQRRRGRSRDTGTGPDQGAITDGTSDTDALAGLRLALADLDPRAFAACFAVTGRLRVPRPDGDVVRQGRFEIEQIGDEIRALVSELSWLPSRRFVSAGQVVEEAVARAQTRTGFGAFGEIQVSMRVVATVDPDGPITGLTLWVDWAALSDPHGDQSAHGAASALVAQARARDARGLRVIQSDPQAAPPPVPVVIVPAQRTGTSTRPPGTVLWWRRHRATMAGSVMAVAAAAVIGWVSLGVLKPITDARADGAQPVPAVTDTPALEKIDPAPTAKARVRPTATARTEAAPEPSKVAITRPEPKAKPKVQKGRQIIVPSAVLFEPNSFDLTPQAQAKLQVVADEVRKSRLSGNIQVNGYTDAIGTTASNVTLSQMRAYAVADALAPKLTGLPVQLSTQGFGERDPLSTNETTGGRQANRRVTIVLPKKSQN